MHKFTAKEISDIIAEIIEDEDTVIMDDSGFPITEKDSLVEKYRHEDSFLDPSLYKISVSANAMQRHRKFFENLFGNYVNSKTKKMFVSGILKNEDNDFEISPFDFVRDFAIRSAVFLGPKRTGELLRDWLSGIPVNYSIKFYFKDLKVKSPIIISNRKGNVVEFVQSEKKSLDTRLGKDEDKKDQLKCGIGTVAIANRTINNLFSVTRNKQHNKRRQDFSFIVSVTDCIAIKLNSHVSMSGWWIYDREIQPFFPSNLVEDVETGHISNEPLTLTKSDAKKALNLSSNYIRLNRKGKRFKNAIDKWMTSMHSLTDDEAQIIFMRVALEALLFSEGDSGNIRLKMATIMSIFLRSDYESMDEMYELISNFYFDSSDVVHGNPHIEGTIDIKPIQNAWNEAALKILEEGAIPQWKDIILK